ncbi:MAG: tetratricopeptide repeat protein [Deltaproteobacteria bacterium]|nr:tetratricopeptide repeat protein [Deltaproteobacteria bacterium]
MAEEHRETTRKLQLFPAHREAFEELAARYHEASSWEELARLYEERLRKVPEAPDALDLRERLAVLYHRKLEDLVAARRHYEAVLLRDPRRWEASDGMVEVLQSAEAWNELAALLRQRVAAAEGSAKAEHLLALAELQAEKLGEPDRAVQSWRAAFATDKAQHGALARAREQLISDGRLSEAARLATMELEAGAPELGPVFASLGERLAAFAWYREQATRLLEQAGEIDADAYGELKEKVLEAYAEESKSWKEQARALRAEAVDARDKRVAADAYLRIAMLHALYADDGEKVRENLERVFLLDPGCRSALDFLEDFHSQKQDYEGLAAAYETLAGSVKDRDMAAEVLVRLSRVREQRLDDAEGGRAALIKVLETDPSHAVAASALAFAYQRQEAWQEAAHVLEARLAAGGDKSERVRLHRELAELHLEHLDSRAAARTHLEAALDLEPGNAEVAGRLETLYAEDEAWEKVARMLERLVEATEDIETRQRLLDRLATLEAEELKRPGEAAQALQRLLSLDPGRKRAVAQLREAAEAAGDSVLLTRGLAIAAELATEDRRKVELWQELGAAWEAAGDTRAASEAYRRVLVIAPADADANAGLERTLTESGSPEEVAEALTTKLAAAESADEKRVAGLKLAAHQADTMQDAAAARQTLEGLLEGAPEDPEILRALLGVLEAAGDLEARIEVLSRVVESDAADVSRGLELAGLLAEAGKAEEATARLVAVDDAAPEHPAVIEVLARFCEGKDAAPELLDRLERRLEAGGEWTRLLQLLEDRVAHVGDDIAQKAGLLRRVASLQEERLADKRAALLALGGAARLTPQDRELTDELQRLATEAGAHTEYEALLGEIYEAAQESGAGPELLRPLQVARAKLRAEVLGDAEGAATVYQRLVEATDPKDPIHHDSLQALARIARDTQQWPELAATLERLVPLAATPPDKARLLLERGEVQEQYLQQHAEAAATLRAALEAGAGEAEVLPSLARALEAAGDEEGLSEIILRQAALAAATGDEHASGRLKLKSAQLARSLGRADEAVEQFRQVLLERPGDPDAREGLRSLLDAPEIGKDAALALAAACEKTHDSAEVTELLERLAVITEGAERAGHLERAAELYASELHQRAPALGALLRAREARGGEGLEEPIAKMAASIDEVDRFIETVEALEQNLSGTTLVLAWRLLAEQTAAKAATREVGIAAYEKILGADAANAEALEGLHALYRVTERWPDLHAHSVRRAELATEPAEQIRHWREAGRVAEERLEDPGLAADAHRKVVEIAPDDAESSRVLDRLYQKLGRRDDLAWVLDLQRKSASTVDRKRDITFRLAELVREAGRAAEAIELYGEVLQLEETHAPAREALEAITRAGGDTSPKAYALLDEVLAKTGNHRERIDLREARLAGGGEADPELATRLFSELRQIHADKLKAPEMAFMIACRQIGKRIDTLAAATAAAELADALQNHEDLWEVLEESAEGLEEGDPQAIELFRRAAALKTAHGSAEAAISAWKRVQALAPEDREVLDQLEGLFNKKADAQNLVDLYRTKVDLAKDGGERSVARLELAKLLEQAGDDEKAIDAFELIVAEPNADAKARTSALRELERLYAKAERPQDQARILANLVKALEEETERFRYLVRLGAIFEEHDGSPTRALEIYRSVVAASTEGEESAPGQAELAAAITGLERLLVNEASRVSAAAGLEPIYRARGEGRKLTEVLEIRLPTEADPDARLGLFREIASLYEERVGQPPLAFMVWCRAMREMPQEEEVRERIEVLAQVTESWEELAGLYREVLEKADPGADWVLPLHARTAEIYEVSLGQPTKAILHRQALAEATGEIEALESLAVLLREARSPELIGVDRKLIEATDDPSRKRALWMEVAGVAEATQPVDAVSAFREIVTLDGDDPDPEVLQRLGRVLSELERWDELCEVLAMEVELAKKAGDAHAEAEWRFRWGRVLQVRLRRPDEAVDIYEAALAAEPASTGAVAGLEEILQSGVEAWARTAAARAARVLKPRYEKGADSARLIKALEILASASEDPEEQSSFLCEIADVYASSQQSEEMAFMSITRALQALPWNREALSRLEALSEQSELQEEEAELLESLVGSVRDDEVVALYLRRLGKLQADAGEVEAAIGHYQRLLEIHPSDTLALDRLSRLTRLEGDLDAHIEVLRRQFTATEAVADRVKLLRQIALVQEQQQGDVGAAMATWRQLTELAPDDREAWAHLDDLCQRQERWTELDDILRREAELAAEAKDVPAQVGYFHRLAELKESRLLDPDGALVLHREVLALEPGHAATVERVEQLLREQKDRVDLARLLEDVYRSQAAWPQLLSVLDVRAGYEPEKEVRLEVLWEMHEIQERRLGSPEMAFILLCRAFNLLPTDPEVRAGLERLAELTEQHEELVAVYEDAIDEIGVPEVLAEMSLTVGRIYETKLEDPETALNHYEQVKKIDPDCLPALQALDRLYRRREDWHDLAETLTHQAELTSDAEEKTAVLFRLGQLYADKMQATDRAVAIFEELLEVQPGHLPALRSIEQLYAEAGAWQKLAANLEVQLEAAKDDAARERLIGRLADVLGEHLGEHERAIGLWKDVLELNKRSEAAQAALERLYEASEQWEVLADHLKSRLERTIDPREITRLNDRLGWVMGAKLGQASDAIASFRAVLERDPRNLRALEALRDIYDTEGSWNELVTVLKRLVPLQDTPEGTKAVRMRLAEVLGRELDNRDEAIEACRRYLDVEPHLEDELLSLEGLLRELKAPGEAVKVMEARARVITHELELEQTRAEHEEGEALEAREASLEDIRAHLVVVLFEIARTYADDVKRVASGAEALEQVLVADPGNREAVTKLRAIYEKSDRWREMATLVEGLLPHAADDEERRSLQLEIAYLQEEKLGQKEMAFLALGRAFAERPDDEQIEAGLFRLAEEADTWDELAVVIEEIADDQPPGPAKANALLKLAEVQDQRLDDPDEAEAAIRQVLSFDPSSTPALEMLSKLFVARGQASNLVVALEQKLEVTGEPEEQKKVLARIAEVYEQDLDDMEEAIATWRRITDLDGACVMAIDNLARIYEASESWDELVGILERAAEVSSEQRADRMFQVGEIHEERRKDDASAIRAWQSGLEENPTHEPSLNALEQIYTRLERWNELLRTYEAQVEATEDADAKVAFLLKISTLQESQFDNPPNALDAYERALAIDPEHTNALEGQIRQLRALEEWERLIGALEHKLSMTRDEETAVQLHIELGNVWHDQLQRVDKAETVFSQALEILPESRDALGALGKLYEKSGNWSPALEMMQREVTIAGTSDDAVEIYHRMGKIYEDMLLDTAAARANYEQALEIDPGYLPAIQSMKSLSELEKDWGQYLEALVQEAKHTDDLARKTRLLHQIGVFYRDQREDPDGAIRYFEEALTKTEDDLQSAEDAYPLYLGREDWERGEQLLRIVCKGQEAAGLDGPELCQRWYKLGYVRQKLEAAEGALEAFEKAYENDPTYLPALEGLGAALVGAARWEEALKIYQAILIHHRESVTDLEVVEYYWQLGEINLKLDERERAVKNFEKALEIDPRHSPALTSLVRILEEDDAWDEAIELRTRLLDALDPDERYEMYLAIGQASSEKQMDPYSAIDAYMGAHKLKENALAPLQSLLLLYRETRQAAKAVEILERLLSHPEVQAEVNLQKRYELTLAEIYRDDLKDPDQAVYHFDRALDLDYTLAPALAAIEEILGKRKRWQELEQAYSRMIQRIPKGPQTRAVRVGLWRAVGDLYRNALRNLDGAIAAYQVVTRADPEDVDAIETYASLLAAKPGAEADAITAFQMALKVTDEPARVARALLRLHTARKSFDRAFCVSAVINVLIGNPEPEEQQFFERIKPYAPERATRSLTDRLWEQQLYHDKLKGPVADILAILYEQAGPAIAVDLKVEGVNVRKDRVDVASSPLYFANMYRYVGKVLGMEAVALYQRLDQTEGLAVLNTSPLSLAASEEMLGRSSKRELWFAIGKAMAFCRPELALGRVLDLEHLDLLLQSAASLVRPGFPVNLHPQEVQRTQAQLRKVLSPEATQALARVVRDWSPERALADLRDYAAGVEHTANRAGILLAGDIAVARSCLMEDKGGAAKLPFRTKVRDLVMFCLSEEFFQVREALGLAVQIPT